MQKILDKIIIVFNGKGNFIHQIFQGADNAKDNKNPNPCIKYKKIFLLSNFDVCKIRK